MRLLGGTPHMYYVTNTNKKMNIIGGDESFNHDNQFENHIHFVPIYALVLFTNYLETYCADFYIFIENGWW